MLRRISSRLVNTFSRWVLWLRCRDCTSALRIYRASTLHSIDLAQVDCRGYAYLEQILVHLQRRGASIAEHPITFRDRTTGESKISLRVLFGNLREILLLAFR